MFSILFYTIPYYAVIVLRDRKSSQVYDKIELNRFRDVCSSDDCVTRDPVNKKKNCFDDYSVQFGKRLRDLNPELVCRT